MSTYGIQLFDDAGNLLGVLWQHLDESEVTATMEDAPTVRGAIYDWSGEWEAGHQIAAIPCDDDLWQSITQYAVTARPVSPVGQ